MNEDQLRPYFEQSGPISHIQVIRDRQTDAHRGEQRERERVGASCEDADDLPSFGLFVLFRVCASF